MSASGDKTRLLELRIEELQRQVDNLRIGVLAASAVVGLIASIAIPMFRPVEAAPEHLRTIGALAGDVDDSFVGTVAVLLIVFLALTALAVVFSVFDRHPKAVLTTTILASLAIADWLVLWVAVANTGGEGTFGGVEFETTLRIVFVPIGATLALFSAHAIRMTDDWRRA